MNEVLEWATDVVLARIEDNTWSGTFDEAMIVAEHQLREFDMYRPEVAEGVSDDQWYSWQEQIAHRLMDLQ